MIVPVLLYKDLQGLSVGEHHICVDAEVEVTAGILTTQIPEPQDQKKTDTERKILLLNLCFQSLNVSRVLNKP